MGTTYEEIFSSFKDGITDPYLVAISDEFQRETLMSLMNKSISRCQRICKDTVDLSDKDDDMLEFNVDVPYEIIDIVTEWMTVFWLKPYLNNMENLRNSLKTKDFQLFSPADLLLRIGNEYESARKRARSLTNEYSYIHADMGTLKT